MKLPSKEIPSNEFFRKINNNQRKEVRYLERALETSFSDYQSILKKKKIVLVGPYLVLEEKLEDEYHLTHIVDLDQQLKFKRIMKTDPTESKIEQIHGFSLINEKGKQTSFLFEELRLAQLWLGHLSKILIQVGFHQHYEVLDKIGNGSSAAVYSVRRLKDGLVFAAKVFPKQILKEAKKRESFYKQIEVLLAIQHKNVLKTYGVFQSNTCYYVISELLVGGSLLERINYCRGLSDIQSKIIMRGILQGLSYLHKYGIMHRDIKLENIMLRSLDSWEVVIVDFGLAVMNGDEDYIHYRCGTPGYIAPEVINIKGKQQIDVICDVFSAGALFHIIMTNTFLFPGSSSHEIYLKNKAFDFDLNSDKYKKVNYKAMDLLKSMLEIDHKERIASEDCLEHIFLKDTPLLLAKGSEIIESQSFCFTCLF